MVLGAANVRTKPDAIGSATRGNGDLHAGPDAGPPTESDLTPRRLYDSHFPFVWRNLRRLGVPDSILEDAAQDVFLVVHRRLPDFDGQNVAGWLYQIARHRVRDFRRLLWVRHLLIGGVPLSDSLSKGDASPADSLETNEKRVLLERLLGKLNESERAAVVLFEIDGYSGEEIAEIQGVPVNTVWARIHKARKKLKASLAKHESREQKKP